MPLTITVAVVSMIVLGTLFGIGLVVAARAFRVDEDPKVKEVLEALPGINCGACGYRGCHPYAEAVVKGEMVNLCVPGGADTAQALAAIMGVKIEAAGPRLRAVVHCQGGIGRCGNRFQYVGERDCRAANITGGGQKDCVYGCLGFGTCAEACPFDAISMSEEQLPVVDPEKCTACGICVRTCPRSLLSLVPADAPVYLGCSSHGRGKAVKDICSVGCIACSLCARKDPHGAIEMVDDLPVLDFEKSGGDFYVAAEVCPQSCFVVERQPAMAESGAPAMGEAPA
jgi:electron transport complex protein RnfB